MLREQGPHPLDDHLVELLRDPPAHRHDQDPVADPAPIASGQRRPRLAPGFVDPSQARGEIGRQQRLELPVVAAQRREVGVLDGHDPGQTRSWR